MLAVSHRLEVPTHSQVYSCCLPTITMIVMMGAEKRCCYLLSLFIEVLRLLFITPFFHIYIQFFSFYLSYLFCIYLLSLLICHRFLFHMMIIDQLIIEPNRFYIYKLKHSIPR